METKYYVRGGNGDDFLSPYSSLIYTRFQIVFAMVHAVQMLSVWNNIKVSNLNIEYLNIYFNRSPILNFFQSILFLFVISVLTY